MHNPENEFAEAAFTIRRCIKENLVTPEAVDNHGTMREWAEALQIVIGDFLGET
jgi:hypothetical protein